MAKNDSQPAEQIPEIANAQIPAEAVSPTQPPVIPTNKKRNLKTLLAGILAGVILFGGTAGAYFNVVSQRPQNVLSSGIRKTLERRKVTIKIALNGETPGGSAGSINETNLNYSGQLDM